MQTTPGRPRRRTRLARALGLDGNPLRRASDRVETWIRVGLLGVFLIAGPMAAVGAGGWAYHAGISAARVHAAPTHHAEPAPLWPARVPASVGRAHQGSQSWPENAVASARSNEMLAAVMTLVLLALALLATLRITLAILRRRRLAAWETAWSTVGPQWTGGRS